MSNEDIDLTAVYLLGYEKGKAAALKQLKPLTDEEICSLAEQHLEAFTQYVDAGEAYYEGEIEFARAIEKKIRGE